jgi:hypothetical protein
VERHHDEITASGDLYHRQSNHWPARFTGTPTGQNHGKNIPVFPIKLYHTYFHVTGLRSKNAPDQGIFLEICCYRFNQATFAWRNKETLTAEIKRSQAADGTGFRTGEIQNRHKQIVGHIVMTRISSFLRRAVIEIDKAEKTGFPENNGNGIDWQEMFKTVGWHVDVIKSDTDVKLPGSRKCWNYSELHEQMMKYRQNSDLDNQWPYHLLVVNEVNPPALGIMYDYDYNYKKGGSTRDINRIPREGAAIAYGARLKDELCFGKVRGKALGSNPASYFRTALHEVGHTMSLTHPTKHPVNHIMETSMNVGCTATKSRRYPDNINWFFSLEDQKKLRHLPDIAVRPGGLPFPGDDATDAGPIEGPAAEMDDLVLQVRPLLDLVPLGAPVRIIFSLKNQGGQSHPVPGSLSMKSGHISGKVVGPCGTEQRFSTIIRCTEDVGLQMLPKGKEISHAMTLLRGRGGPLFPSPGYYRVILELDWDVKGSRYRLSGEAELMVMTPEDEAQARAALKIFSTPETLHSIAISGDHHREGREALRIALENPVLKPHFSVIEAKRLGKRSWNRQPDLKTMTGLIDKSTVMSPAEIKSLLKIIKHDAHQADEKILTIIIDRLKKKIHHIDSNEEILELVQSIKT